jgi:hypothetical protein
VILKNSVYHRGVGVDQTQDLLIMEKLDVLIIGFLSWFYHLGLRITGNALPQDTSDDDTKEEKCIFVVYQSYC